MGETINRSGLPTGPSVDVDDRVALLRFDGTIEYVTYTELIAGVSGAGITEDSVDTLTNKTIDDPSNDVTAKRITIRVRNATGSSMPKGSAVRITGYNAGNELVTVALADASSSATLPAIGLTKDELANNTNGEVEQIGRIEGVDTSAYSVGDLLYVSETAGALTDTAPASPAVSQHIGTVLRSHATLGVIQVAAEPAIFDPASLASQFAPKATFPVLIGVALSDETTALTTGTAKAVINSPFAFTLTGVIAYLTTASSSGLPTVDINEGAGAGTSVLSTKLTIDANETTSTTAATPAVISDSAIADGARLTFDIDVAGTGAAGLKVWLVGTRVLA